MVDGGGLENHCTRKGTGGSNPSPSAILRSLTRAKDAHHSAERDGGLLNGLTSELRMTSQSISRRSVFSGRGATRRAIGSLRAGTNPTLSANSSFPMGLTAARPPSTTLSHHRIPQGIRE